MNVARIGAVGGFAALALVVNPALGSATVTGTAAVTTHDNTITVAFTGVGSPTLVGCWAEVVDARGNQVAGNVAYLTGGQGSYVSEKLPNGKYTVRAVCLDDGGATTFTPVGGQSVTLDEGRTGVVSFGSVTLDFGNGSVGQSLGS